MSGNISRQPGHVEKVEDMYGDVAGTYRSTTATSINDIPGQLIESDLATLDRDGYLIVECLLPPELCTQIADTVSPSSAPSAEMSSKATTLNACTVC
jgi:hypothetical protein